MKRINKIKAEIEKAFDLELTSPRRTNEYHFARMAFMSVALRYGYRVRDLVIALERTHATIIYYKKTLDQIPQSYKDIADQVYLSCMNESDLIAYLTEKVNKYEAFNYDKLTENEMLYRALPDNKKATYDERVSVMLKML